MDSAADILIFRALLAEESSAEDTFRSIGYLVAPTSLNFVIYLTHASVLFIPPARDSAHLKPDFTAVICV